MCKEMKDLHVHVRTDTLWRDSKVRHGGTVK